MTSPLGQAWQACSSRPSGREAISSLEITDPDGNPVTPTSAGVEYHEKTGTYEVYDFLSPAAGQWHLVVTAVDVPAGGEAVTVRGETYTPIAQRGSLSGTVRSAGQGLGGVKVTLSGIDASATTLANGTYTISDVNEGSYTATFSKQGYVTGIYMVTITAGQTTTQDVVLNAAATTGTLTGSVTSGGQGLGGASMSSLSGSGGSAITLANGAYTISNVGAGTYTATFQGRGM